MNRHRRREAKAARRRRRLKNETPERREARELRRFELMDQGAKRMFRMVEQPKKKTAPASKKKPRRRKRGIEKVAPETQVPIPCRCDTVRAHGPHWVEARRLQKGGDLHGRVRLDPGVVESFA